MNRIQKAENEILELIDKQDDITRSDLQGRLQAILMKAIENVEPEQVEELEDKKEELKEYKRNLRVSLQMELGNSTYDLVKDLMNTEVELREVEHKLNNVEV